MQGYSLAHIPEGEHIEGGDRYAVDIQHRRLASSAGHIYRKPVISAESYSWLRFPLFMVTLEMMKAASDAQFLDPHVSVGQVTAYEAIGLTRKIPFEAVMRMALVGRYERISAERALALGMVSQVVDPPEDLRQEAQVLAEKIARNSPAAMAATKRALWGALEAGLTDACQAGAKELVSMWGHPDQEEGPRAFAEKRDPQWAPPTHSV